MPDITQIMVENGKTDQKVERKLHMVFVNVGESSGSPEWELQGRGVEDASVEYNMDVEQTTDILGRSDTTISAAKPQMNFDPNTLRVGQKLNSKLVDILRRGATSELGTFQVLIVYMFLSESGTGPYEADQYANCSIVPTSMGGSDYVGLPFDLYLSGDVTAGTATITPGEGSALPTVKFTAAGPGVGG